VRAGGSTKLMRILGLLVAFLTILTAAGNPLLAQEAPVHGLWVRKTPILLDLPSRGEALRNFCRDNQINDVYLDFTSQNGGSAEQQEIEKLINLLHHAHIRVEALLSSPDADQPGPHRDQLMNHVQEVLSYNKSHSHQRFDGIHLDIKPWDRQENKASGDLGFLPGLLDAYQSVRVIAEQNEMTVNADITPRLLKADLTQRRALMTSLPRLTLLQNEANGSTSAQSFQMAYQGLDSANLARMAIGLKYSTYHQQLAAKLADVQNLLSANPHYLGWAWHSYNDVAPQS
jgi:hypothetical protein